jgi:hypothetical protein
MSVYAFGNAVLRNTVEPIAVERITVERITDERNARPSNAWSRRCRNALCLAFGLIWPMRQAAAHPIHTTMTAVTADRTGLVISVRTFADDFSASVATFVGKQPPADWSVSEADVARYLDANLRIFDGAGHRVPLKGCGVRREREVYWLCVRIDGRTDVRTLQAENRILVERHADQVNIVQVDAGGARKTVLFTKNTRALPLSG